MIAHTGLSLSSKFLWGIGVTLACISMQAQAYVEPMPYTVDGFKNGWSPQKTIYEMKTEVLGGTTATGFPFIFSFSDNNQNDYNSVIVTGVVQAHSDNDQKFLRPKLCKARADYRRESIEGSSLFLLCRISAIQETVRTFGPIPSLNMNEILWEHLSYDTSMPDVIRYTGTREQVLLQLISCRVEPHKTLPNNIKSLQLPYLDLAASDNISQWLLDTILWACEYYAVKVLELDPRDWPFFTETKVEYLILNSLATKDFPKDIIRNSGGFIPITRMKHIPLIFRLSNSFSTLKQATVCWNIVYMNSVRKKQKSCVNIHYKHEGNGIFTYGYIEIDNPMYLRSQISVAPNEKSSVDDNYLKILRVEAQKDPFANATTISDLQKKKRKRSEDNLLL